MGVRILGLLAASFVALLLAGCSAGPAPPPADPGGQEGATVAETQEFPFGRPAMADAVASVGDEQAFDVPEGALSIAVKAEWSCVSLCPLHCELWDPDLTPVMKAEGGSGLKLSAASPAAGTWRVNCTARDQASVGVEGTFSITTVRPA